MARAALLVGLLLVASPVAFAQPLPPPSSEAIAEREALIQKIASGQDYEHSVARYAALYKERQAQKDAFTTAVQQKREQQQRDQQDLVARLQSLDFLVAQHCTLSVDPTRPPTRSSGGMHADFGKVVRKEQATIKGKTAFQDDETITIYRVQGAAQTYSVSSKSPTQYLGKGLSAAVGDLVLICYTSLSSGSDGGYYPPDFRDHIVTSGFAVRLAAPPRIVDKQRWDPIHMLSESPLAQAIRRADWLLPAGKPVLGYIHVLADLGQGQFEIAAEQQRYVLEVPATLKNRELMRPGKYLWAIMTNPRFVKEIKKLVLQAEDLEPYYVQELQ